MVNLSDYHIPDDTYIFLSLGSAFIIYKYPTPHDFTYDTDEFCRKLAWQHYTMNWQKIRICMMGDGTGVEEGKEDDDRTPPP